MVRARGSWPAASPQPRGRFCGATAFDRTQTALIFKSQLLKTDKSYFSDKSSELIEVATINHRSYAAEFKDSSIIFMLAKIKHSYIVFIQMTWYNKDGKKNHSTRAQRNKRKKTYWMRVVHWFRMFYSNKNTSKNLNRYNFDGSSKNIMLDINSYFIFIHKLVTKKQYFFYRFG